LTEALLLIGHGSRVEKAVEGMFRVADLIRAREGLPIVECAFYQYCPPTVEEALERCVAQGAKRIWMIPYFLHTGIHLIKDLPGQLEAFGKRYPGLEIALGRDLGGDPLLADVVMKRVGELRDAGPAREEG
jgi:sirohydrochlorin ferrochelatase